MAWLVASHQIPHLHRRAAIQLEHGAAFSPPRPLLRAMAKSLWADGSSATPAELATAALRAAPFLKTPAADLARSILDAGALVRCGYCSAPRPCQCGSACTCCAHPPRPAVPAAAVHWSAELVAAQGPKAVTGLTAVLSLAPHASRSDATQRELHTLRLVGSTGSVCCACLRRILVLQATESVFDVCLFALMDCRLPVRPRHRSRCWRRPSIRHAGVAG